MINCFASLTKYHQRGQLEVRHVNSLIVQVWNNNLFSCLSCTPRLESLILFLYTYMLHLISSCHSRPVIDITLNCAYKPYTGFSSSYRSWKITWKDILHLFITAPQRSAGAVINCLLFVLLVFSIFLPSVGFSFSLPLRCTAKHSINKAKSFALSFRHLLWLRSSKYYRCS